MSTPVTKMSRITEALERAYNIINRDWFNGELETPTITIIPCSSRPYIHCTIFDAWYTANGKKSMINVSSACLHNPLDKTIQAMIHEMVHLYNRQVLGVFDTSRQNTYHNRQFAIEAVRHGLSVEKSDKYGYSITTCSPNLFDWICEHDELREIAELCRANPVYGVSGIGGKAASGTTVHRNYRCPKCGNSVRATCNVNIACLDCAERMIEV